MKLTDTNKGQLFMSAAVLALGLAPSAYAQSASPLEDEARQETVIVTGIRSSLEQATEIKRNSDAVMDVITAEDIGKLPDNNVAEALQRVTGVQVTRVFGEGQAVSIRGLQQVRVEVDNRTLLAWSARVSPPENDNLGRSSGLDSVPSSAFGRLEVFKSATASQTEGGLGGLVNLVTPKPLDFNRPRGALRGQLVYSDQSERLEPTVGGFYTTKFFDDKLGVMVSGEYQERTSNLQKFERNGWFTRLNGGSEPLLAPRLLQYESTDIDRTRAGINGAVQYDLTPEFRLTIDGLYSKINSARTNQFISFELPTNNTATIVRDAIVQDGYIVAGEATGRVRTGNQYREDPTENWLYGVNGKHTGDRLTVEGDLYYSKGTLRQKIEVFTLESANNSVLGTYDFRGGAIPSLSLATLQGAPWDPTDYANYVPQSKGLLTIRAGYVPADMEETSARFDVGYRLNDSLKLSGGLRYTDLSATFESFRSRARATRDDLVPFLNSGNADFLSGISGDFPRFFLTAVPGQDFIIARGLEDEPNISGDGPDTLRRNEQRDFFLTEKVLAAYVQIDGETELLSLPARYNVGVRVAETDFEVNTYLTAGTTVGNLQTDNNKYTNVLPSANLTLNLTDDLLVRFAASQTLQRAGLQDLAPSTFVNVTNNTSTSGNASLKPPTSTNFDVSLEWYFDRGSLLSGAVFAKDVKDFIATSNSLAIIPGFESIGEVLVTRPDNVASAEVRGFEVGVQHFFENLPGPLDGLGVIANYTYSDAKDSNGFPLIANSKHSYNLSALYERGRYKARVAYNWRDDAVLKFTQDRPDYIKANSQLDAQLSIDLTKQLALSLQGQNLIPEDSARTEIANGNPLALNAYSLSERRLSIGLRARF